MHAHAVELEEVEAQQKHTASLSLVIGTDSALRRGTQFQESSIRLQLQIRLIQPACDKDSSTLRQHRTSA